MGYAIARASIRRGAEVILISGPSCLEQPHGLKSFFRVETAQEMRDAMFKHLTETDVVIMAAAPADFSPEKKEKTKINKTDKLLVNLRDTPDILSEIGKLKKKTIAGWFCCGNWRKA